MNQKRSLNNAIFTVLLVTAALSLLAGLYAGLIRLGFLLPAPPELDGMTHGPLMINGFLATLISLERAAAFEKIWTYLAPLSFALSIILLLAGYSLTGGFFLLTGSLLFLAVLIHLWRLHPAPHHLIMALGSLSLLAGNVLFLSGEPIYTVIVWWIGFPLLTIFGERLELNRIMRPPARATQLFTLLCIGWIGAAIWSHLDMQSGWRVACLLLILSAVWLIRYDVARRTIRSVEWTRYSAFCLLSGYGWLIVTGVAGLWYGLPAAGPIYDALLHMIFVGFVFSMIFAHAAVIIPSLTGRDVPYHAGFYLPAILLHLFLLMRVVGDLSWLPEIRRIGSYGNVVAILLFFGGILFRLAGARVKERIRAREQNV